MLCGSVLAGTALLPACGSTPPSGTTATSAHSPAASTSAASPAGGTGSASAPGPVSRACPATAPLAYGSGYLSGIQFVSSDQGWVVGQREILATSDGGQHWTVQDSGSLNLTSVDFISAAVGWAVGTNSLLTTADGGAHWTALDDPCLRSVHFVSPEDGFATAGGRGPFYFGVGPAQGRLKVLATTDGGRSWHALHVPAVPQTVCFDNAEQGWLGAAGRLYRSTDGGRTWKLVTAGARPPRAGFTAWMIVRCAGDGAAWALDIGPGAEASQEPHIGYYASPQGTAPLFAEQYFPHPGVTVTTNSPGSDPGPISAISPTSAAFIDFCPACEPAPSVPWDLVTGTSVIREGDVSGLTQPESASFLSSQLGWVAGIVVRQHGTTIRWYQRIVTTSDGGRNWRVLFTS
jgi:Photosynthesis system II assembly factor YCF48/BNR/Asp-box repeat